MKHFFYVHKISKLSILLALVISVASGFSSCGSNPDVNTPAGLKVIRFGMLPYGDHTYAIIGAKQDWFKEVGIDFQYQPIKIEEVVPFLKNAWKLSRRPRAF